MSKERKHDLKKIRNFSIIAHIDHGKSTIADRLLELTQTVAARDMQEQLLDGMDLERERGITIKAHPVTMRYQTKEGEVYEINLIDTPGHVDFTYEVSRSLSACEGALLVVDAGQGVQAQSLANVHLALERNLEIVPVINKIDLPTADVEGVRQQIEDVIGLDASNAIGCSAKTGIGIDLILDRIILEVPPPKEPTDNLLRALVFDSHYDNYRGVMVYVRIMSGEIEKGSLIRMMATDKIFEVLEVGKFTPKETPVDKLMPGDVGYMIANIKVTSDVKIGDTVTLHKFPAPEALPGFKVVNPVVFAGIYPIDSGDFESLRDALNKLQLNDSALHIEQESSQALGFGFRCGFLGLLHLEIVFERLQREFDVDIISTAPSVVYKFSMSDGEVIEVDNPAHYPDPSLIDFVEEPFVKTHIITPTDYLGVIMSLGMDKRGSLLKTETIDPKRVMLTYRFPMNEIITDFHDKLKSITRGYASFDYEFEDYAEGDIIKLEIRVNEEPVDAFSCLVHRTKAESKGRAICSKLVEVIPQQLFKVPVQAAIGGKVIARETIRAITKNVTAKCYGGDISRKRKLWDKQKKGKKRMKEIGKVNIPQSAFMDVLKAGRVIVGAPLLSFEDLSCLKPNLVPVHVAIIPDGNRRWSRKQELSVQQGHSEGADILMDTLRAAKLIGVKVITFYVFSTENWSRLPDEVAGLMALIEGYLLNEISTMQEEGVCFHTIGNLEPLPDTLQKAVVKAKRETVNNNKINLVLALNYGARDEMVRACKKIIHKISSGELVKEQVTEQLISEHLDTCLWPEPDLLIRTSGERRLSNFLLWQLSYAEVYVTPVLWPDFRPHHLLEAVYDFQKRQRRLGGDK